MPRAPDQSSSIQLALVAAGSLKEMDHMLSAARRGMRRAAAAAAAATAAAWFGYDARISPKCALREQCV